MKDIIKIGMDVNRIEDGVCAEFGISIHKILDEILTKKEVEEIEQLTSKISKIISKGVRREIELEEEEKIVDEKTIIKEALDETSKKFYEKMSDEDKKKADKFEKELEKCESIEEAIALAIKTLEDEIK